MLRPGWLLSALVGRRVGCLTGVPCSYVSGLYRELESGAWPYLPATSEGESVAVAAGSWLGGSQGVALCQNSGLGNMTNPLSSLVLPFRIPVLLGVSRRGWPPGTDEPQHTHMGEITPPLLTLLGMATTDLSPSPEQAAAQLDAAVARCAERRPSALVIGKGVVGDSERDPAPPGTADPPTGAVQELRGGRRPTRRDVLATYLSLDAGRAVVSTTGYISRELYGLDDRDGHFYMVGSMGCAAGIGVGVAAVSGRPVTVLDGDGALLMRLGSLATVAQHVRTPFLHVVLDNGQHESTGGQRTGGPAVGFAAAALACGYRAAWRCDGTDALAVALGEALQVTDGPVLVHCLVRPGSGSALPRPAEALPDLALRFRHHLAATSATRPPADDRGGRHGTALPAQQRAAAAGPQDR